MGRTLAVTAIIGALLLCGTHTPMAPTGPARSHASPFAQAHRSTVGPDATVVTSIPVGVNPLYIVVDERNGWGYVMNGYSDNVTVINGTTVVGSVKVWNGPLLNGPYAAAYDDASGYVYVAGTPDGNVSILKGTALVGTLRAGANPSSVTYDSRHGYVYVTNDNSANVTVIDGTTLLGSVRAGSTPTYSTYDPWNNDVYVSNLQSADVTVINGLGVVGTVAVGGFPNYSTCDESNGWVYVANDTGTSVSVINGTTLVASVNVGSSPSSLAYDPGNGFVYVTNSASNNVSVINGTKLVGSVNVGAFPRYAAYDSGSGSVFVTNWRSANVSVIEGLGLVGTVAVGIGPRAAVYDDRSDYVYVANNASNTVSAIFEGFNVTFTESGLPSGTNWSVALLPSTGTGGSLRSSTSTSITFELPAGSYTYRARAVGGLYGTSSPTGSVLVSGTNVHVPVSFSRWYAVSFTEGGLPAGTNWSVDLNGSTQNSSSARVEFSDPNGTYPFTIAVDGGYSPSPATGFANVTGTNVSVAVTFQNGTPLVSLSFQAVGLPPGANWSVAVTATAAGSTVQVGTSLTRWSTGNTPIHFQVSAGSYAYTASSAGYQGREGSVRALAGTPSSVTVQFVPVEPATRSNGSALAVPEWAAGVGVLFVVIGGLGLAGTFYRHERRERERGRRLVSRISDTSWMPDESGEPTIRPRP